MNEIRAQGREKLPISMFVSATQRSKHRASTPRILRTADGKDASFPKDCGFMIFGHDVEREEQA
jgi:hypothetical protein